MPKLETWGNFVDKTLASEILMKFSKENNLKIFPGHRVKGEKSFLYKALYRKKSYADAFIEIENRG